MPELSDPRRERFARFYAASGNAAEATRNAGYKATPPGGLGHKLLQRPDVIARVAEINATLCARADITAQDIIDRWADIATADINDLVQHRIGACRYCHGTGHEFQWTTPRAFNEELQGWIKAHTPRGADALPPVPDADPTAPHDRGGYGYKITNDPNPDCPECAGLGIGYVRMNDTTKLTGAARHLFQGVKVTQNGTEIQLADQSKAVEHLANRLGVMKPASEDQSTNPLIQLLAEIRDRAAQLRPNHREGRGIIDAKGET